MITMFIVYFLTAKIEAIIATLTYGAFLPLGYEDTNLLLSYTFTVKYGRVILCTATESFHKYFTY